MFSRAGIIFTSAEQRCSTAVTKTGKCNSSHSRRSFHHLGNCGRKVARMEEAWTKKEDYLRRQHVAALAKVIEAENALEESKQDYIRLQRETIALLFPESVPVSAK